MSRYIDADALDDLIMQLNDEGRHITRAEYKMIDNILFEMPTADVRENVHGEWIVIWENGRSIKARCDQCNEVSARPLGRFCKWCGAEMHEQI